MQPPRDKAQKAAAEAGIPDVYTDPMELIQRDDLAAVSIITPPGAHHALSIAALQARKARPVREALRARRKARTGAARRRRKIAAHGDDRTRVSPHAAARVHQATARRRLHRQVPALHDRALPRSLRNGAAAAVDLDGAQSRRRRAARRARLALHRWAPPLVRRSRFGERTTGDASPGPRRCRNGQEGRSGDRRYFPVHAYVQERRHGDDDRVVCHHADARRKDRGHGRQTGR